MHGVGFTWCLGLFPIQSQFYLFLFLCHIFLLGRRVKMKDKGLWLPICCPRHAINVMATNESKTIVISSLITGLAKIKAGGKKKQGIVLKATKNSRT